MIDFERLTAEAYELRTEQTFDYFRQRRADGPVAASVQDNVWEVFGLDAALQVLHDPATFSSDKTSMIPTQFAELAATAAGNFIGLDPPAHTRLRALVNTAFTPRTVTRLEPRVRALAVEQCDAMLVDGGRVDLVQDYSSRLSSAVIADLFGIPGTDHTMFWEWSDGLLGARAAGALGSRDPEAMARLSTMVTEAGGYLLEHIARRRADGGDDLTSELTRTDIDGQGLADHEIFGIIGMFLIAGHLSTSVLVGNVVTCLDEHPHLLEGVRTDPAAAAAFLEEVLRWRPPLIRDQRVTRTATTLGGVDIPAGADVTVWLASANRDEAHVVDGETFDPTRSDAGHRAFGHGIHYCLGAPLARLETTLAMSVLLERVDTIELQRDAVRYHPSIGMLGPVELPATVDRVGA